MFPATKRRKRRKTRQHIGAEVALDKHTERAKKRAKRRKPQEPGERPSKAKGLWLKSLISTESEGSEFFSSLSTMQKKSTIPGRRRPWASKDSSDVATGLRGVATAAVMGKRISVLPMCEFLWTLQL